VTFSPSVPMLALLIALPLIAWRLYSRFRRLVGRQRASRVRPWITLTLFPLLAVLLAYAARSSVIALAVLAAALIAGAALGRYGLAKTRFEASPEGLYYTPHAPLGIALFILLAGRVAYRLLEVTTLSPGVAHGLDFVRSPATLAVFGLIGGYYVAYAAGLVRWRHAARRGLR
jgi:hypothetical protein